MPILLIFLHIDPLFILTSQKIATLGLCLIPNADKYWHCE